MENAFGNHTNLRLKRKIKPRLEKCGEELCAGRGDCVWDQDKLQFNRLVTNYKLQITNYKLQITNYKLQITV